MNYHIIYWLPDSSFEMRFGISYGIGRKYRPIWVSVSVLDLNQNSGFGRTLGHCVLKWGFMQAKIFVAFSK